MAANVKIAVNLDATQATQLATQLGQQLAEASINASNVYVDSSGAKTMTQQSKELNRILNEIIITVQQLNISLAKTGKMMQEINRGAAGGGRASLFGDYSQLKNESKDVFDTIIKQSEETIEKVKQGVKPVVEEATKPVENLGNAAQKAGEQGEKAAKDAASAAAGLLGKKRELNTFAAVANQLFSPITIAVLAFEAAIKVATYAWNNLTESTNKMITRAQTAIKSIQHKTKSVEAQTKSATQLIKQLQDLNSIENRTIDQNRLAESIVAKLNKQYKDLNITLDETTGKYRGLYQAQILIDQRNKRAQVNALRQQMQSQRDIVNAALKNAFGSGISLDQTVNGSDFFTLAEKIGGTLGSQNADILANKWNTHDLQKQLEVIDQLIQGLSSSESVIKSGPEARQALQVLIDYRKQLQELNSIDSQIVEANKRLAESFKEQADALKKTLDEVNQLNKSLEQNQRTNSLAGLDPEDRANALRAEVEQLEKRNKALQDAKKAGEEQTIDKRLTSNDDRRRLERQQGQLKKIQDSITAKQQQIEQKRQQIANLVTKANSIQTWDAVGGVVMEDTQALAKQSKYIEDAKKLKWEVDDIQASIVAKQKEFNTLQQQANETQKEYQKSKEITLEHEQALAELDKEHAQNMLDIQAKEQEIAQIEKQLAEERAAAELKAWQLQQERIAKYDQYVNGLFRKQNQTLNEILGKKKESLLLETRLNAQKMLGRKLTEEELAKLEEYVQLDQLINQYRNNQKLNIGSGTNVITNQIASKGGYASSIVIDRSVDINKQILDVQKSQSQTLKQIKNLTEKNSVIQ